MPGADSSRHRLTISLALLAPLLPGQRGDRPEQGLARERIFGSVRDADGAPWVGATVHVVGRPMPGDERCGTADALCTRTDVDGRFRVAALPHLDYSVWAMQDDGRGFRVTGVEDRVRVGTPVMLEQQPDERVRTVVQLTGLARWKDQAPFRAVFRSWTHNVVVASSEVSEEHTATVPAWPRRGCTVLVFGAGGYPLVEAAVSTRAATARVAVPAPVKSTLQLLDAETSRPLRGVELLVELRDRAYSIGRHDDGARISVPHPLYAPTLVALAPRRAAATVDEDISPAERAGRSSVGRLFAALRHVELKSGLVRGATSSGRLLLTPGEPAAGVAIRVATTSLSRLPGRGGHLAAYQRIVRTDASGRFAIGSQVPEHTPVALAVLDARHAAALPGRWRERLDPVVPLLLPAPAATDAPTDVGAVDLSAMCPLEIAVTRADGSPADRPTLRLVTGDRRSPHGVGHAWTGDRAGRISLLLPSSERWMAWIDDGESAVVRGLSVRRAAPDTDIVRLAIRLGEPRVLRGVVLDRAGEPVEAARVFALRLERTATTPEPPRPLRPARTSAAQWWDELRPDETGFVLSRILTGELARTDADGRFRFPVPSDPGAITVHAMRGERASHLHRTTDARPLELRLDRNLR